MVNISCVTLNWSSLEYFLFAFQFQIYIYIFDIQLQYINYISAHISASKIFYLSEKTILYTKHSSFCIYNRYQFEIFRFFSFSFNANVIISHVYVIRLLSSPDIPCLRHGSILPPFLVCTYSWSKTSVVIDIHIRIYSYRYIIARVHLSFFFFFFFSCCNPAGHLRNRQKKNERANDRICVYVYMRTVDSSGCPAVLFTQSSRLSLSLCLQRHVQ